MSEQMNNTEVVQELYRAFRQKDYEAFRKICTSNIEWIQNEGFPRGSTRYGAEAVIDGVFETLNDDWELWQFQIEEYLDAGRSIIVLGFYKGTHRASQKAFRAPAAHVYDLVAGKVARFRQFTDTKLIWDAMS